VRLLGFCDAEHEGSAHGTRHGGGQHGRPPTNSKLGTKAGTRTCPVNVLRYRERMADQWYSPGYRPPPLREHASEALWTLERNGRQVACQLRDHGEPAGAEVQLLKSGEFYADRRFDTRDLPVWHADHVRESLERDGWRVESPSR
jgi:hypothetical protein